MSEEMTFKWISFYEELSAKLLSFRNNQKELISTLKNLDIAEINKFIVNDNEISPFAIFEAFNRQNSALSQRKNVIEALKHAFDLTSEIPDSLPDILKSQKLDYFEMLQKRNGLIEISWNLLQAMYSKNEADIIKYYDDFISIDDAGFVCLTVAMYWAFPARYLPCSIEIRKKFESDFGISIPDANLKCGDYLNILKKINDIPKFVSEAISLYSQNNSEWLPKDYNPGISKEKWIELIKDKTVFTENSLLTFACIQNAKIATCADMAKEFGRTPQFYNNTGWQTGQRVFNKTGKQPPKDENDQIWFWSSCCSFRKNKDKLWEFKIYPELKEAFEETGILDNIELHANSEKKIKFLAFKSAIKDKLKFDKRFCEVGNEANEHIWIGTRNGIIGNLSCHYEFYYDEKIFVDTHFENFDYKLFKNVALGTNINHIKWQSYKDAVRINEEGLDINSASLIDDALNLLNKMDETIGKELEMILTTEKYKELLLNSHNLILHGAPGTGKTHLAKKIAESMGSEVGFVQFHPSYDYTDFVEGLRPVNNGEQIGFERKDGIFKEFCEKALKNLIDSEKSKTELETQLTLFNAFSIVCDKIQSGELQEIELQSGAKMDIAGVNEKATAIYLRTKNSSAKPYTFSLNRLMKLSEFYKTRNDLEKISNIDKDFRTIIGGCHSSGYWGILNKIYEIKETQNPVTENIQKIEKKNFVFIIDEINRGEMSKIFGELFFSIDPGYRGKKGLIKTQYQNLIEDGETFADGL